jgi:hypothetical protein
MKKNQLIRQDRFQFKKGGGTIINWNQFYAIKMSNTKWGHYMGLIDIGVMQ